MEEAYRILGNFVFGSAWGALTSIFGLGNKGKESIEEKEALSTAEEQQREGFNYNRKKELKRADNIWTSFTILAPSIISFVRNVERDMTNMGGQILATGFGAYVGTLIGKSIRRIIKKEHYKELALAREIVSNSADHDYILGILPEKHQNRLSHTLEDICSTISNPHITPQAAELELKKRYAAKRWINIDYRKKSDHAINKWFTRVFENTKRLALLERAVKEFYTGTSEQLFFSYDHPKKADRILVFNVNGDTLTRLEGKFNVPSSINLEYLRVIYITDWNPRKAKKLAEEALYGDAVGYNILFSNKGLSGPVVDFEQKIADYYASMSNLAEILEMKV